jgi:hypothetical protein
VPRVAARFDHVRTGLHLKEAIMAKGNNARKKETKKPKKDKSDKK